MKEDKDALTLLAQDTSVVTALNDTASGSHSATMFPSRPRVPLMKHEGSWGANNLQRNMEQRVIAGGVNFENSINDTVKTTENSERRHSYWARFVNMLPRFLHRKHISLLQYKQDFNLRGPFEQRQTTWQEQSEKQAKVQQCGDRYHQLSAVQAVTHEQTEGNSASWQQEANQSSIGGRSFPRGYLYIHKWRRNILIVPIDVRPRHHAAAGQLPFTLVLPLEELRKKVQVFRQHMFRTSARPSGYTGTKEGIRTQVDRAAGWSSVAEAGGVELPRSGTYELRIRKVRQNMQTEHTEASSAEADATNSKMLDTARVVANRRFTASPNKAEKTSQKIVVSASADHTVALEDEVTSMSISTIRVQPLGAAVAANAQERASDALRKGFHAQIDKKSLDNSICKGAQSMHLVGGVSHMKTAPEEDSGVVKDIDLEPTKVAAACDSAAGRTCPPMNKGEAKDFFFPQPKVWFCVTTGSIATVATKTPAAEIENESTEGATAGIAPSPLSTEDGSGRRKTDMSFVTCRQAGGIVHGNMSRYSLNALDIFVAERLLQVHPDVLRSTHIVCVMLCRRGRDSSVATSLLHELKSLDVVNREDVGLHLAKNSTKTGNFKGIMDSTDIYDILDAGATTPQLIQNAGISMSAPAAASAADEVVGGVRSRKEHAKAKVRIGAAPSEELLNEAEDPFCLKKCGVSVVNLSGGLLTLQQLYFSYMPVL